MFKHILVPLDGSLLAENALPAANFLASKLPADVTLLHVIEENAPQDIHGDRHLAESSEAQTYLKELASQRFDPSILVETHVHHEKIENVAQSIVSHVQEEFTPDLIILCAHGKGGLRDIFLGNIAQQVLTSGKTPVLLIDVTQAVCNTCFELNTILLPLDGDPQHEQAFSTGKWLASRCGAGVILLRVIPTLTSLKGEQAATSIYLPGAMNATLDQFEEDAEHDLADHLQLLSAEGIHATTAILRGDPASEIAEAAERTGVDLIVLGTHTRVGSNAFWSSSVAAKVSQRSQKPILFIPV